MKSLLSLAHSLPYAIPTFLALLNPVSAASASNCSLPPAPTEPPGLLPSSFLPFFYYQPPLHLSAADQLNVLASESQIRDKLTLYALSLDGKNFTGFDYVFTPDALFDFDVPIGVVRGRDNIKEAARNALAPVDTQLVLATQVIKVYEDNPCTASSLTYFVANFFELGAGLQREARQVYGQFRDRWYKDAAGEWFITLRLTDEIASNLFLGNGTDS